MRAQSERLFYDPAMSRRPDPDRIAEAKRAGLTARLRDTLGSEDVAEALMATYHDQSTAAGITPASPAYWDQAETWLAHEVERRLARG